MVRRSRSTKEEKIAFLKKHPELHARVFDLVTAMKKAGLYSRTSNAADLAPALRKLILEALK